MKTNKINFDNDNTILNKWFSEQTDNINNILCGKLSASGSFLQTIHSLQYDFFIYDECDNIYGITFIIEDDIMNFVSERRNITVNSKEYALDIVDYFIKKFDISMTYLEENKQLKLHELIKYEKHYGKHIDSNIHKWLNYQANQITNILKGKIEANGILLNYRKNELEYCFDMEDEQGKLYSITFLIVPNLINFNPSDPEIPSVECAKCITKFIAKRFNIEMIWK